MTDEKGPGRLRLEEVFAGLKPIRDLRYDPDDLFDDVPTEALDPAIRWLRAASFSALTGARKLERILNNRTEGDPAP